MKKPGFGIRGLAFGIALLILAMIHVPGCNPKPTSKAPGLFPATHEVPGWTKTGEVRTFEAANLWEYIDGDAEKYLQAGVDRTLTADYRYQDKVEAAADIFIMKTPEGARKVFESESSTGSQPIQLGDEARLFPSALTFRKGRYFVRLVAYEEAPETGKALTALGQAIERMLPQGGAAG